jgi:iron complex outermembrane recepter protein
MNRSRITQDVRAILLGVPLGSLALVGPIVAVAQEQTGGLQEVIVTAQKRSENLQDVPISLQALGTERLNDLHVQSFEDYAKYLPTMTFQTFGPGTTQIVMRGVSSSGADPGLLLPTVATYLDEQPVTTILGTLDVHIYDIARIEALAGPQGTLYGASSEAGTLRIITNKPDPRAFAAGYDLEGNTITHGGQGYIAQGFVNIPLSPSAAVRLVGFEEEDAGFIDNVPATRTYPSDGICIANFSPAPKGCMQTPTLASNDFNKTHLYGGRAALKLDLNDSWTVTPQVMAQKRTSDGDFGYTPALGDLEVHRWYPDNTDDHWTDASLTVEGKISDFDLVYAGALLKRDISSNGDYTDYSLAYDRYISPFITNFQGQLINPSDQLTQDRNYTYQSHELRLASPQNERFRGVAGLFYERQASEILENYQIDGVTPALSIPGWPNTWWLTRLAKVDADKAVFGELTYDLLPKLSLTGGIRYFRVEDDINGYIGYSAAVDALFGATAGGASCFAPGVLGAPCTTLNSKTNDSGHTPKVNLTYHVDDQRMVYATWSKGFRPGGVNTVPAAPPYQPDYLTNYELGWKTTWAGGRLRFNGAIYDEEWKDFQFTFVGVNGISERANAGTARIRGVDTDFAWAPTKAFTLSGGLTALDPKLTENYCGNLAADGSPVTSCPTPLAPSGTQLPGTSKWKGDVIARYQWRWRDSQPYVQGAYVYQTTAWSDLRIIERDIIGPRPSYGVADFAVGVTLPSLSVELYAANAFDKRAQLTRYTECGPDFCGAIGTYVVPIPPRTIGLRLSQKFGK